MSKEQLSSPWKTEYNNFDFDNDNPETLKEWETEFRRKNWRDMRNYLKQFPDATQEEKNALRNWVRSGHSPYENGAYIANDSGGPMDFINAQRFLEEEYLSYIKGPESCCGSSNDPLTNMDSPSIYGDDDLPF